MKDFVVTSIEYEGRKFSAACLFENLRLEDFLVERADAPAFLGGIYLGSLESRAKETGGAFIRLGKDTKCFVKAFDSKKSDGGRVLVQITKEAAGHKQAAATQEIKLAGRYAVVSLRESGFSVSAKLSSEKKRILRELFKDEFFVPDCHVLLRTEAADAAPETVRLEVQELRANLRTILKKAESASIGSCLAEPEPFYLRFYEHLSKTPDRILTDLTFAEEPLRQLAKTRGLAFAEKRPGSLPYQEIYGLKTELEKLLGKCIHLKHGAELMIQPTEAFVSVDVNSAHFKGPGSPEKNALLINKEAIFEVFRQMRLRCLSGVVLVDLINMNDPESRREALSLAKELAVGERVKTEAVDITPLGILEIIRKKSGPTLFETLSSRQ